MNQTPDLICETEKRRHQVRKNEYNGLDYLEVSQDQMTLTLYFLDKAPEGLTEKHIRISGGRRIRDIQITDYWECIKEDPEQDDCVNIAVNEPGDFSTYTLCLLELDEDGRPTGNPFPGFDPRYACLDFSFKVDCDSGLDCQTDPVCPTEKRTEPEINYLAKDYASFRQLILDRLALTMPDWQERHVPDLGIALVELLAYTGDRLSYYQDAVATEAYLHTARQRISIRRHARLVDYQMHEGCNARAWVHVDVDSKIELPPDEVAFITGYNDALPVSKRLISKEELEMIPASQYEQFEPLLEEPASLLFRLSDWKDPACMAFKIWHKSDNKMLAYLKEQFTDKLQEELQKSVGTGSASERLQNGFVTIFNRLIQSSDFRHEIQRKKLWLHPLTGEELLHVNRALLEDAFSQEVAYRRRKDDPIVLYPAHNEIHFYTWDDTECCLPRGATRATLRDEWLAAPVPPVAQTAQQFPAKKKSIKPIPSCLRERQLRHLQPGDILVFEEVRGPKTGHKADADPSQRHVVRLTEVKLVVDPLHAQPVVEIAWAVADALPFPLCLSAVGRAPDCELIEPISVARGNIVLVDHGATRQPEGLGTVLARAVEQVCLREERPSDITITPALYRPILQKTGLTFSQSLPVNAPASAMLTQEPRQAVPQAALTSSPNQAKWEPQRDLLGSGADDHCFVTEIDNDGQAHLRFGDGELGKKPEAGMVFTAVYRTGNGPVGNVGAEAITHMVMDQLISGVTFRPRNPLPAQGGVAAEPIAEVKLFAPHAFRRQLKRAITADDYAQIVMRDFADKVQRAAAALRWTGSWTELLVVVDPLGKTVPDPALLAEIEVHLYRYRRIGHEVVVKPADYAPLDVALKVCVLPNYLQGHVKAALLARFSNRLLPDGQPGFFHPDALTFGEGVYLSKLTAVAQAVTGVESVVVTKLERFGDGPNNELEEGILRLGPLEIARVDNDPSWPENGRFTLDMEGRR